MIRLEPQRSPNTSSPHVAVIGGGIAGLSAALTLQEAGLHVTIIEASDRLGGKIRTECIAGCIIEAGPDSILSYKPSGLKLIERLGLLDRVRNTRDNGPGTYILHRGRLQPLPEGMSGLVPVDTRSVIGTDLLSWPGKLRLALEYILPARKDLTDESVGSFVRRRLGSEFYRSVAEPLLSGIYAGDADQLSLQSTFPRLRETEKQHGSLIRGALAQRRSTVGEVSAVRKWTPFISLADGLSEIIDGLVNALSRADIRTGLQATEIHPTGSGYRIEFAAGKPMEADGIVLATPAWAAAKLLRPMSPQLARDLDAIPYVSTATISMAFSASALQHVSVGRGFVIPRSERKTLTALTFSSNKFDGRAPADTVLVRGYVGRANDQDCLESSDVDLVAVVRRELAEIVGLTAEPLFSRIYRWPRALPQYNLGHPERLARIETLTGRLPAFTLTGAAYRGVGIPDCIQDGIDRAGDLVQQLERIHPPLNDRPVTAAD